MPTENPAPPNIPLPWPGPRLLVPVSVNVFLQNKYGALQTAASNAVTTYLTLNSILDAAPVPFNGQTGGNMPVGATISWALPSALTRADKDTGLFPPIPNRWLVVRRALQGTSSSYVAWVIESDFSSANQGPGTNQYPTGLDPNPNNQDTLLFSYFGRAVPLGQWPDANTPTAAAQPPLTAVGPGDPSFPAFQPGMLNVLSYNDPLSDLSNAAATLTYWVAGWYAQPALDPLYCLAGGGADGKGTGWTTKADWLKLMDRLNWSVGSDDDLAKAVTDAQTWTAKHNLSPPGSGDQQLYPAQILCHGLTYQVAWPEDVPGSIVQQNIPYKGNITIGVGRTTIEAFAAMVASQINATAPGTGDEIARLIQALQYHLLDTELDQGGPAVLDEAIHDGAFGARKGGTIWQLKAPSGSGAAPLSGDLVTALAGLNRAQAKCDDSDRQIAGARQELYNAWYLYLQGQRGFGGPTIDYMNHQKGVVQGLLTQSQPLVVARDAAKQTLCDLIKKLNPAPDLTATPAPPFFSPLDPVVSIYGAGRDYVFNEDVGLSPDDTVFCRFSGQTMTGINAGSKSGPLVTGESLLSGLTPQGPMPYDVPDLAAECLLLDTAVAPQIAQKAGLDPSTVPTIKTQQTIQWNGLGNPLDQQSTAEAAGLVGGIVPCVIAAVAWNNAWVPLYLDWTINWKQYDPSQWTFDGADFTLTNPASPTTTSFTGRTILTPNAGNDLYRTILSYADNNPNDSDAQKIKQAIVGLKDIDVLSQRLSGFGAFLQTLQINQPSFLPNSLPADCLPGAGGTVPYQAVVQSDEMQPFLPVPAGQFDIGHLWVVDAFGQVLSLIGQPPPQSVVTQVYATAIQAPGSPSVGQLPPRVIQPTRLEFDLLDADDASRIVAQDPGANPICGWLLPNHLDLGVSVYDQAGSALGEVVVAGAAPNQYLQWRPTPGNPQGLGQPPNITNVLLADVINTYLLDAADGVVNLNRLLKAIDETLSSFHPPVAAATTSMAAAIGNPVAVVSASVTVRLSGPPVLSQAATDEGKSVIGDAGTFNVPFQLGSIILPDDGLLGYFQGGNFSTLLTLAASEGEEAAATPANAAQFHLPLLDKARGPTSTPLVLLMDPRGSVHVSTGCFPVGAVKLPQEDVVDALANMLVTFQAGPVLTDLPNIRIPVPSLGKGTWTWRDRPTPSTLSAPLTLTAADAKPVLPAAPLTTVEGWLQLSGALAKDATPAPPSGKPASK